MGWISTTCYSAFQNQNLIFGCCLGSKKVSCAKPQPQPQAAATPWLMLPPIREGGSISYKWYSLSEERVITLNKRRHHGGGGDSDEIPPDHAKIVGSSHGWLALFDEISNHVFLSNPISDRHIRLPAIDSLPDPHINLFEGRGSISRVILSCSPDDKERECHAMTTFGPGGRVAFCSGIRVGMQQQQWFPVERAFHSYVPPHENVKFAVRPHVDFVHGGPDQVFSSIQPCPFDIRCGSFIRDEYGRNEKHCEMLHWDIFNPNGPNLFVTPVLGAAPFADHMKMLQLSSTQCLQVPHLVCVDQISDTPLIVLRIVNRGIGDNGSPSDPKLSRPDLYRALINTFPYRSVCFLVLKIHEGGLYFELVEDLKGLAIFVGMNHSFAIPATGMLKPNSIYFTDAARITPPDPHSKNNIYGGHDIGIFDYQNKTISPCYYPSQFQSFKRIQPPPIWFTPNPF